MNPNRVFVIIAVTSFLVSVISLFSKLGELQGFLFVVIVSLTLLTALLLLTRKYWRGARSVR